MVAKRDGEAVGWMGCLGWMEVNRCKLLHLEWISGSSHRGSAETNLTSIHEDTVLIPGLSQWVKDPALP